MPTAYYKIPRNCGHNLLITPEHCSICALEDEVKALQLELSDEQGAYDALKEMFNDMTDCGDCQSVAKIKARAEAAEARVKVLEEALEDCVSQGSIHHEDGSMNHGCLSAYEHAFPLLVETGRWEWVKPGYRIRFIQKEKP